MAKKILAAIAAVLLLLVLVLVVKFYVLSPSPARR
jgi:hypothetical protein